MYTRLHCWIKQTWNHSSSSLGSRCVLWLGEGLSMPSPNYPVLCCPQPYRVAPVFVQVVSPPLGWSPLPSFLVIWSPSGYARGPSVVFEAVDMPCPGPFHFSHSVDYIYELCPLLSLQADGKVAFEDIPVFGVHRPACHDSSLYLFVLVLFLEAAVLSQVHIALDIFYEHIVHVYRGGVQPSPLSLRCSP